MFDTLRVSKGLVTCMIFPVCAKLYLGYIYIGDAIADSLLFGDVADTTLLLDLERAMACASCNLPLAISGTG